MIKIEQAVSEHGAEAVYKAACAGLEGNLSKLQAMGVEVATLGEAWQVQSAAYRLLTPGQKAMEQMEVNAGLSRFRLSKLCDHLEASDTPKQVQGKWRVVRMCFDQDAGEWLNVGVMFTDANGLTTCRLIDSFEKLQVLYDGAIDESWIGDLLSDLADAIHAGAPTDGDTIKLGDPLYAAGDTAQQIVDDFFCDVVALGRSTAKPL